jgi:hypothetical protein
MRPSHSEPRTEASATTSKADGNVIVLDDLMGGFRDWLFQYPSAEFVFLRPDRYVAAVCNAAELNRVSAQLRQLIEPQPRNNIPSGAPRAEGDPAMPRAEAVTERAWRAFRIARLDSPIPR